MAQSTAHKWQEVEWGLLTVFVCARAWNFFSRLGISIGFDRSRHLHLVERIHLLNTSLDNHSAIYAYHPPVGFIMPNFFFNLGLPSVVSVQIISALASLMAFIALRKLLKHHQLLAQPLAIAWLYTLSSLPLVIHSSTSINLDVIIYGCFAIVLLLSAVLSQSVPTSLKKINLMLALVVTLALALLTKFSGALLLPVPLLYLAFLSPGRRQFVGLTLLIAVAGALVLPYYHREYKVPEGTFFPVNAEWFAPEQMATAHTRRNRNPAAFLAGLLAPQKNQPSLVTTWQQIWQRPPFTGQASRLATGLGSFYNWLAFGLSLVGGLFTLHRRPQGKWHSCGRLFIAVSLMQMAALLWFIYRSPIWGPEKAIYILPAYLGLVYLAVQGVQAIPLSHYFSQNTRVAALAILVGGFIVLNHVVPIY